MTRRTMLACLHVISAVEVRQGCIFCWLCASAMCAHAQARAYAQRKMRAFGLRTSVTCFGRLCFLIMNMFACLRTVSGIRYVARAAFATCNLSVWLLWLFVGWVDLEAAGLIPTMRVT